MQKILVCQHVPHEILGTLNPLLKTAGFRIRYVNFGRYPNIQPDLGQASGLIILGGPMNIGEENLYPHLLHEQRLIEQALKSQIPILGICLGAQLIATTLGARVQHNGLPEIGWHPLSTTESTQADRLLNCLENQDHVFHWHSYRFDLPQGSVALAASRQTPFQAFRYGDRVYGFQFHLEVDAPLIKRWLHVPYHQNDLIHTHGPNAHDVILNQTHTHLPRQKILANEVFGNFIKLFGIRPQKVKLSSR